MVFICPLCLYTLYIWMPPYVQRVLIGYLFYYIINCFPTLEAIMGVVRLRGCPYASYVDMPPVHLNAPHIFGHSHTFGCPHTFEASKHIGGIQTYGVSKHKGGSKHMGHPNIKEAYEHRGHMDTPLSLTTCHNCL